MRTNFISMSFLLFFGQLLCLRQAMAQHNKEDTKEAPAPSTAEQQESMTEPAVRLELFEVERLKQILAEAVNKKTISPQNSEALISARIAQAKKKIGSLKTLPRYIELLATDVFEQSSSDTRRMNLLEGVASDNVATYARDQQMVLDISIEEAKRLKDPDALNAIQLGMRYHNDTLRKAIFDRLLAITETGIKTKVDQNIANYLKKEKISLPDFRASEIAISTKNPKGT
jgi:hypothetical protein